MSDPQDQGATPDVMQAIPMMPATPSGEQGGQEESITQPAKLLRIASMVRELLEQTRQASLEDAFIELTRDAVEYEAAA